MADCGRRAAAGDAGDRVPRPDHSITGPRGLRLMLREPRCPLTDFPVVCAGRRYLAAALPDHAKVRSTAYFGSDAYHTRAGCNVVT